MNPFAYEEYKNNLRLINFGLKNPLSDSGENEKMGLSVLESKEAPKGQAPDFKGDGIAIWVKKDKNGKEYLSCCILGNINVPAWKFEVKPK